MLIMIILVWAAVTAGQRVVSAMVAAADSGNMNKFCISAESAVFVVAKQCDRNVFTVAL